jgi:N-acetylglucosamine kinase-like BadF-type ATPase
MKYFLGIDVGSSKTHALISDEMGRCVGFGRSGGGNHQGAGYDGLAQVLQESFAQAREMSGVDLAHFAGAGFGVAGYDFPSERESHLRAIARLGLPCPVEVVNDGLNGLFAGASRGVGVNVTAGSSVNCRGRNKKGKEGRIVGNGATFGEFGGGSEITVRTLQMVNYAWIKRNPPTRLTKILLEVTGARDELDLMEGISNDRFPAWHSPRLVLEVVRAAQEGDETARGVFRWAGEELGWLAVAVARQIEMENEEVEIIQSGSVFEAGQILTEPMRDLVLAYCPRAKLIRLDGPPAVGAVILGMEQAACDGYAVRDPLVRTAKEIVSQSGDISPMPSQSRGQQSL